MTKAEITALNALTSNFEGTAWDEELNFAGKEAIRRNLQFAFQIVNSSANDIVVAINPANFDIMGVATTAAGTGTPAAATYTSTPHYHNTAAIKAAGFTDIDAVLDDGTILTSVVVTAKRGTIRDFLNFVKKNFCFIPQLILDVDDKTAYNQDLVIRKSSPFRKLGDDTIITLSDYFKETQFQDKKITINLLQEGHNVQFDDQSIITVGVGAGRTMTFNLKIGLIENFASKYNQKVVDKLLS